MPTQISVELVRVFAGVSFAGILGLFQAPGDDSRFFVMLRSGVVSAFPNRSNGTDISDTDVTQVLDISAEVDERGEGGLLGMAFHPSFAANRQVYLSYTAPGRGSSPLESRLSRFVSRDGGRTFDPNSEVVLLRLDQPYSNHNGGHIAFGADGYLYMGLGDGGSGGDPQNYAQNPANLLGAMLRLDVNTTDPVRQKPYGIPSDNPFASGGEGAPEVYAWGLRNPWRFSFDRRAHSLWVGDVGQNNWEEIDIVEKGGNYGWRCREGKHNYDTSRCPESLMQQLIDPIYEYPHSGAPVSGISITGGYVYRGSAIPELHGIYIFSDFSGAGVWGLRLDPQTRQATIVTTMTIRAAVASLAEDNAGEIYALDLQAGIVRKVVRSRAGSGAGGATGGGGGAGRR